MELAINNGLIELFRQTMPGPNEAVQKYTVLAAMSGCFSNRAVVTVSCGGNDPWAAAALASNVTNAVHAFDTKQPKDANKAWENDCVTPHLENLWDVETRATWAPLVADAALVFVDHPDKSGTAEAELYAWLLQIGFSGAVVFSGIWFHKAMRDNLWFTIPSELKVDLTPWGDPHGTGLVRANPDKVRVFVTPRLPQRLPNSTNAGVVSTPLTLHEPATPPVPAAASRERGWTVVTAYFDLTKRPDASDAIRGRPPSHYLSTANMTMALDQNLVVYCDAASVDALRALRPAHLLHKTKFVVREFEDFVLVKRWYDVIQESRSRRTHVPDPRNTTSYYLFCMLRYVMLQEAMADNVFASSHFAWCNVCIERMGWKSGAAFPAVWAEFRDKFSTCYIDYQPKVLAENWAAYYSRGGLCSMCSGFFTGNAEYMSRFCAAVLSKFEEVALAGYGHADEQLFSLVYFQQPELFEFYLGDYAEMIVNYGWITENPLAPMRNVLTNLARSRENPALLRTLVHRWVSSYACGAFKCDDSWPRYVWSLLHTTNTQAGKAPLQVLAKPSTCANTGAMLEVSAGAGAGAGAASSSSNSAVCFAVKEVRPHGNVTVYGPK